MVCCIQLVKRFDPFPSFLVLFYCFKMTFRAEINSVGFLFVINEDNIGSTFGGFQLILAKSD